MPQIARTKPTVARSLASAPPASVESGAKLAFTASAALLPALVALAYWNTKALPLPLAGAVLLAAFLGRAAKLRLRALDWAILLVPIYEIPSLSVSRYPANGAWPAKSICLAILFYFLSRLLTRTNRQFLLVSALVGIGGALLAWLALSQFSDHFRALGDIGLSGVVAFRARLITPPWVPGEWFTLVLLTLPFAFAVPAFLWLNRRPLLAAMAALMPLAIATGLLLSCSRAVFWGLVVFFVVVFAAAAIYRTIPPKVAAIAIVIALGTVGLVLVAENGAYPGIASAYLGSHTSQSRSTEGRLSIWKRSADVFALSPVWGVGSGNAPLFLAASADEDQSTGFASRTFSLPVQILVEKGIVGAAIYLSVLLLAAWEAHRKLRNPNVSPQMKGMTCCFVAGVIAVLFRELTYSSLLEHAATAMLFTMCLAFLVSAEEA